MSAQQSLTNLCSNCPLPNNLRLNDAIPEQYHPLWEGMTWFCLLHNVPEDDRWWDEQSERSWELIKRDDPLDALQTEVATCDETDDANEEASRMVTLIQNAMDAIDEFGFSGNWSDDEMVNACQSLGIETVDAQD